MKIYTGTGDSGKTSLFSGERLKKNDKRIEAYGTVDELSSFIGVIESALPVMVESDKVSAYLKNIQNHLFSIGAVLATASDSPQSAVLEPFGEENIVWLEETIDTIETELEELRSFILPGGHPASSWSHVARTVCRRCERCIVALIDEEENDEYMVVVKYINRLSDFFFVLARFCNKISKTDDVVWHG